MKEAYYFPHDANARTDAKILELRAELGWEGYGLWWALVEQMREAGDYKLSNVLIGGLAMGLAIPKEKLRAMLDLCISVGLLVIEGDNFYSPSLRRRLVALDNKRLARVESARNAAEKRWQCAGNADAMRTHSEGNASAMPIDATIEESTLDLTKPKESKEEQEASLRSADAATAAASQPEKKIESVQPQSPPVEAPHTRPPADVPTRKARPPKAGQLIITGPLAALLSPAGEAARVQSMTKPLTQVEADALVSQYGQPAAAEILKEMANYAKLTNSISANLTARKWLDKRITPPTHANAPFGHSQGATGSRYNTSAKGTFGGFASRSGSPAAQPIGGADPNKFPG